MRSFNAKLSQIAFAILGLFTTAKAWTADLVVLTEHFAPYNYNNEAGKLTGYSTELLNAVLKEAKITSTVSLMPWARAYQIASTQPNTLLYTTTRIPTREHIFEWVGPIGPRKMLLFKLAERKDIQITNSTDLKKYKVGIVRDTSAKTIVLERGLFSKDQIDDAPSTASNVKKLFYKRIDLILGSSGGTYYELGKTNYQTNEIEPVFTFDDNLNFYFAVNKKSDPLLIEKLHRAFEKIRASGLIATLKRKYLVD